MILLAKRVAVFDCWCAKIRLKVRWHIWISPTNHQSTFPAFFKWCNWDVSPFFPDKQRCHRKADGPFGLIAFLEFGLSREEGCVKLVGVIPCLKETNYHVVSLWWSYIVISCNYVCLFACLFVCLPVCIITCNCDLSAKSKSLCIVASIWTSFCCCESVLSFSGAFAVFFEFSSFEEMTSKLSPQIRQNNIFSALLGRSQVTTITLTVLRSFWA